MVGVAKTTPEQKLVLYLNRCTRTPQGCFLWPGATSGYGYPVANMHGRGHPISYLHREMYSYCVGKIPEGFVVDHICTNHCCLNPDHLRALSYDDNIKRDRRDRYCSQSVVYSYIRSMLDGDIK